MTPNDHSYDNARIDAQESTRRCIAVHKDASPVDVRGARDDLARGPLVGVRLGQAVAEEPPNHFLTFNVTYFDGTVALEFDGEPFRLRHVLVRVRADSTCQQRRQRLVGAHREEDAKDVDFMLKLFGVRTQDPLDHAAQLQRKRRTNGSVPSSRRRMPRTMLAGRAVISRRRLSERLSDSHQIEAGKGDG